MNRVGSGLIDVLVVVLLATGNFAFDPSDPGWLSREPTPWLILPVWLGLRYGIAAGISTASGFFLFTMVVHTGLDLDLWGQFIHHYRGLLYWTVALGAISGEVCSRWNRVRVALASDAETLELRLRTAKTMAHQLIEARDELAGAMEKQELGSLDDAMGYLSGVSREDLPRLLLLAAQCHGRVSEAAFYQVDSAGGAFLPLRREAFVGRETLFPPLLQPGSCEVVDAALENRRLASVPHLFSDFESHPSPSPYLIAVPLCTPAGEVIAVLLITALAAPSSSNTRLLDTLALIAARGGGLLAQRFENIHEAAAAKQMLVTQH
jgi:hypothetical protein